MQNGRYRVPGTRFRRHLDVMKLHGGGNLSSVARAHGVEVAEPLHRAAEDARVTAAILDRILADRWSDSSPKTCEVTAEEIIRQVRNYVDAKTRRTRLLDIFRDHATFDVEALGTSFGVAASTIESDIMRFVHAGALGVERFVDAQQHQCLDLHVDPGVIAAAAKNAKVALKPVKQAVEAQAGVNISYFQLKHWFAGHGIKVL